MSMAHGLEVRCPLLDRRVVGWRSIPASRKQQGTQGKALLRALAQRRLPGGCGSFPLADSSCPLANGSWTQCGTVPRRSVNGDAAVSTHIDRTELAAIRRPLRRAVAAQFALWAVCVLERWFGLPAETASVGRRGVPKSAW
jgi:asparagine synthetase B (glutamine-hydrolysing)